MKESKRKQISKIIVKINFLQDFFTILEELTGDCPGVGLPKGFKLDKKHYNFFKRLQKKHKLTKIFFKNHNKIKKLKEFDSIKKVQKEYRIYWKKNIKELIKAKNKIEKLNYNSFLLKLEKITKHNWITKKLIVFLTLGYKNSGTYDRLNKVIRIGIHQSNKPFLGYTLFHELIHFHIVNHMKLKLKKEKEEILCRAIFSLIFKNKTAEKHWKKFLSKREIKEIKIMANNCALMI